MPSLANGRYVHSIRTIPLTAEACVIHKVSRRQRQRGHSFLPLCLCASMTLMQRASRCAPVSHRGMSALIGWSVVYQLTITRSTIFGQNLQKSCLYIYNVFIYTHEIFQKLSRYGWQHGRVVKASDSKSDGLCPRGFESLCCRIITYNNCL